MRQGNGEILKATALLRSVSGDVLEAVREIDAQIALIRETSRALLHSNDQTETVVRSIRGLVAPIKTSVE